MNTVEALHCSGCGAELGLEPITAPSTLTCRACGVAFAQYVGDSGSLFDCTRCGGQFVEHALLKELLERQAVYPFGGRRDAERAAPRDRVVYRPCPCCQTIMNRKNFGRSSGVIVDVCARHGVWFDAGELPRVIDFVRSGGLARAQEAEREERQQTRRAARAAELSAAETTTLFELNADPLHGLADALRELIRWVLGR
jgi:Zn-finger nucleic acid-binding protein